MLEVLKEVHIMYGLPGSGKTYFSVNEVKNAPKQKCRRYMDLDAYARKRPQAKFEDFADTEVYTFLKGRQCVPYIDGLITTHENLGVVMRAVIDAKQGEPCEIIVHVWNEDRETCKINDIGRREVSSRLSIENMPYEPIKSIEDIWKAAGNDYVAKAEFKIERHTVIQKPEYKQFFAQKGLLMDERKLNGTCTWEELFNEPRYIKSESWSAGGTMCSYTGSCSEVWAEEPVKFTEFLDLIEMVDPKMPFKTGVRIWKEAVTVESENQGDYYGGSVTYLHYQLDLQKMYEVMKAIEEEEKEE